MNEILRTIIENLVENKDKIQINEIQGERNTVFEVKVASDDMGRVIGKEGRVAKSIRTILKAVGAKEQKKISVEFIDD